MFKYAFFGAHHYLPVFYAKGGPVFKGRFCNRDYRFIPVCRYHIYRLALVPKQKDVLAKMGMDGLYRPSQMLGYMDSLGHLDAAERVLDELRQSNSVNQQRQVNAIHKDSDQEKEHRGGRKRQQNKDDSLAGELKDLFVEVFNIEFQPDGLYRFWYNEAADKFELLDETSQTVLLALSPEEFLKVTQNIRRQSGIITDQTA